MNTIANNTGSKRLLFTQRWLFKLFSKIKYGTLVIEDATGTYRFQGTTDADMHAVHLHIHDLKIYQRILFSGTLGAGETYIDGSWDVDNLTGLIELIIKNTEIFASTDGILARLVNSLVNVSQRFKSNNIREIKRNILAHYDLGNEFFKHLLDPSMMYSCAIFEPEDISLAEASTHKIDLICQKLRLQPSDHLLEIGSGWGGLAIHAATKYGCKVTTTTISDEQYSYVKQKIACLGLKDKIELLNTDYRHLSGQYDKVVSIEMIEAIGYKNFDGYFRHCNALLKPKGLFFLQAILINDQAYSRAKKEIDFIKKYIFPGGCLPSIGAISKSIAKHTQLQLIHFRDIGKHYSGTLHAWLKNLNEHVSHIKEQGFSEEFIRMWRYYFCYSAAAFNQTYITDVHALWRKRE